MAQGRYILKFVLMTHHRPLQDSGQMREEEWESLVWLTDMSSLLSRVTQGEGSDEYPRRADQASRVS